MMVWTTKTVLAAAAILGSLGALMAFYQQEKETAPAAPSAKSPAPFLCGGKIPNSRRDQGACPPPHPNPL